MPVAVGLLFAVIVIQVGENWTKSNFNRGGGGGGGHVRYTAPRLLQNYIEACLELYHKSMKTEVPCFRLYINLSKI